MTSAVFSAKVAHQHGALALCGGAVVVAGALLLAPFLPTLPWMSRGAGAAIASVGSPCVAFAGIIVILVAGLVLGLSWIEGFRRVELLPDRVRLLSWVGEARLPWECVLGYRDDRAGSVALDVFRGIPWAQGLRVATPDERTRVELLALLDEHGIRRVEA